jgi:hypothetical protein
MDAMPRRVTEPSKFELAVVERLGLDPEQILIGSLQIEYTEGDDQAVVRWRGARAVSAVAARELLQIAREERQP